MSRRSKIAIVAVLVVIVAALIYLYLRSRQQVDNTFPEPTQPTPVTTQPSTLPTTGGTTAAVTTPEPKTEPKAPPTPEQNDQAEIKRLAAAFAERFGSYSSSRGFDSILDLKYFMTDSMAAWADGYVKDLTAKSASSTVPFGTTTRSLVTDLKAFDGAAGSASVNVSTQREETVGMPGEEARRVYYQDIKLDFLKVSGEWKVNAAYWQKQ